MPCSRRCGQGICGRFKTVSSCGFRVKQSGTAGCLARKVNNSLNHPHPAPSPIKGEGILFSFQQAYPLPQGGGQGKGGKGGFHDLRVCAGLRGLVGVFIFSSCALAPCDLRFFPFFSILLRSSSFVSCFPLPLPLLPPAPCPRCILVLPFLCLFPLRSRALRLAFFVVRFIPPATLHPRQLPARSYNPKRGKPGTRPPPPNHRESPPALKEFVKASTPPAVHRQTMERSGWF